MTSALAFSAYPAIVRALHLPDLRAQVTGAAGKHRLGERA